MSKPAWELTDSGVAYELVLGFPGAPIQIRCTVSTTPEQRCEREKWRWKFAVNDTLVCWDGSSETEVAAYDAVSAMAVMWIQMNSVRNAMRLIGNNEQEIGERIDMDGPSTRESLDDLKQCGDNRIVLNRVLRTLGAENDPVSGWNFPRRMPRTC